MSCRAIGKWHGTVNQDWLNGDYICSRVTGQYDNRCSYSHAVGTCHSRNRGWCLKHHVVSDGEKGLLESQGNLSCHPSVDNLVQSSWLRGAQ